VEAWEAKPISRTAMRKVGQKPANGCRLLTVYCGGPTTENKEADNKIIKLIIKFMTIEPCIHHFSFDDNGLSTYFVNKNKKNEQNPATQATKSKNPTVLKIVPRIRFCWCEICEGNSKIHK
jgi:hypothetical protein